MTEEKPDPGVPLMAFALDVIRKGEGDEPFVLHPDGGALMTAAAAALMASPEEAKLKKAKLRSVLAVAYVLGEKQKSPKASRALIDALTEHVGVAQLLGIETKALRRRGAELKKFLGDEELKRAPKLEDAAPVGSLKLSSFLDPGRDPQARARAGKTTRPKTAGKKPARRGMVGFTPPNKKG